MPAVAGRVHLPIVDRDLKPANVIRAAAPLTVKGAEAIAGTLGHPSKMPGYSYGISAQLCVTGSKLRQVPGSVCSSCYAMTDWYRSWRPLLFGHERRERGIRHSRWVEAMVVMVRARCTGDQRWFRFHDAGDIRGVWHLEKIVEVVRRTPEVSYWLPTREYEMVAAWRAAGGVFPPNLCVRLSAHMIDAEPVVPPELADLPTSTVSTLSRYTTGVQVVVGRGSVECRAVAERDNKCGSCRACWTTAVQNVEYPQH